MGRKKINRFETEEEELEFKRNRNREYQAKFYKKNRARLVSEQRKRRKLAREEKIKNGTYRNNENLRGNILNKLYTHPKNTFSRTDLQRMTKDKLIELLNKLEGDK